MVSLRMSCNGCRVLRKGCSEDCSIRPCLQWIETPQAQANATVFLAKFYGRTGLLNLINAGPNHLRPAIFQSLLHEACGRIVNPIYGSTGLFCSGNWHLCEAAVEAVLSGSPIAVQMSAESDASKAANPPFKACNIRHVAMKEKAKPSGRIKRAGMKPTREPKAKSRGELHDGSPDVANAARVIFGWTRAGSPSQESGLSQHAEPGTWGGESEVQDSHFVEPHAKLKQPVGVNDIELELTL